MAVQHAQSGVPEALKWLFGLVFLGCGGIYFGCPDMPKLVANLLNTVQENRREMFLKIEILRPHNQRAFIAAVLDAREAYMDVASDGAKQATRESRSEAICAIKDYSGRWVGLIDEFSTNGGTRGVLAIRIAPHLLLKSSANNRVSDLGSNTLSAAVSPLYETADRLRRGDPVVFANGFIPSDTDCIEESSPSLQGSMIDPSFVAIFHDISPL